MIWLWIVLGVPLAVVLMPKFLRALLNTPYGRSGNISFQYLNFYITAHHQTLLCFRIMVLFEIDNQPHLVGIPTDETSKSSNLQHVVKEIR